MDKLSVNKLLDLTGKTAIVTGATGIGYGISYRLAEAGANVLIASRDEAEVRDSVEKLRKKSFRVKGIRVDIAIESDIEIMVKETTKAFGAIDILVNNAGIYPSIPIIQMELKQFRKVIAVNLEGVFLCTKHVSEQMIRQGRGGKIINITSIDAIHPSSIGLAHYDTSKHGVWGFTKNAALELAPHKIWINAIAPGGILTEGVERLQSKQSTNPDINKIEMMENFLAKIPMGRMGTPDDIGKVALFLASDMSSYITGEQIVVDGGVLLS